MYRALLSYPDHYDVLKNFLNKEIFIEDLTENLIRLLTHFDSTVLSKEKNFYSNKKYDNIFQLIDVLSKDEATIHTHKLSFCEIFLLKNFKSKFLSAFNDKNDQSCLPVQSQSFNSNDVATQDSNLNKNIANAEFYRVNNQIRNLYRNKLWTNFTISMFNRHLEKGTTPSALFYDKFPRPYLSKDKDFVEGYNKIIERTQIEIINLCISHLSKRIDSMDIELKNIQTKLKSFFQEDELAKKFDDIESKEEFHLRPNMKKSMEKVNNIYAKKFEVIDNSQMNSAKNSSYIEERNNSDGSINNFNRSRNFNRQNFNNFYSRNRVRSSSFIRNDRSRSMSNSRMSRRSNNSSFNNLSYASSYNSGFRNANYMQNRNQIHNRSNQISNSSIHNRNFQRKAFRKRHF
ncbi:unnamed protein product [Brachionus calyciflorus]|uniref:Uncharacterized protein n=1 Tax=Brachionus calyciflorus TaxID=104777 RepID=A0A814E5N4_9BILA|nr:unnamed protein product [Brachionus calyciflorus]